MKKTFIKKLILLTAMLIAGFSTVLAQSGLNVDKAFSLYGHAHGCKMVEMHDAQLHGYRLHVYKALTYKKIGSSIETYLKADRKRAKKIREVVTNGQIESGYYMMNPTQDDMNRYILFSNGSNSSGAVIYIEGNLSPDDILKLCYSRK